MSSLPVPVIVDLNIIIDPSLGLLIGLKLCSVHQLALKRTEERFHDRIVVTVSPPAEAEPDFVPSQQPPHLMASVLPAPVSMKNQASLRPALEKRLIQGIQHQFLAHSPLHRPAHHLPIEEVQQGG